MDFWVLVTRMNIFQWFLALWLIGCGFGSAVAESAADAAGKLITAADIQQKIQQTQTKQNLSEDVKARILASYNESLNDLNELKTQEQQAETLKLALTSLPGDSKQLARQIDDSENALKNRKPEKLAIFPNDELELRLIQEKTELSDLDAEIGRVEASIGELSSRMQLIREKMTELKNKQALNLQLQHGDALHGIDNIGEKEAKQLNWEIKNKLINATLKTLELENIGTPLRLQLEKDRMRLLNLQRQSQTMLIADVDNLLLDRRQQQIDREQAELLQEEKAAAGKHTLIQQAMRENIHFNFRLREVTTSIERFLAQKNELDGQYQQLEKDSQSAQQKINLAGLSPALGNLLREQRRNLPQAKNFSELNDNIQNEIGKTSLESFKLEETKKNLADINLALSRRMDAQLLTDLSDADRLRLRSELRMLLSDQKDLAQRLSTSNAEYAHVLGDVDFSLRQVLNLSAKYSEFLDQRLLWVPSAPVIDKYFLSEIGSSLVWLAEAGHWARIASSLQTAVEQHPFWAGLAAACYGVHLRLRRLALSNLRVLLSPKSAAAHLSSLYQILTGLGCLLVLALTWPLLFLLLAVCLLLGDSGEGFSHAFARGLLGGATSLAMLQFFIRLFQPAGLAELLFQWRAKHTKLLYSQFRWLRYVAPLCIFVEALTGGEVFSEHSYALGRAALIVQMLSMTYSFHRLAHPRGGLLSDYGKQADGWRQGAPYLAHAGLVLLPLAIIGFAWAGYYQSALELQQKLIMTFRLVIIAVLLHEFAQRWLALTKRRLAARNALQKRKQGVQAAADGGPPVEPNLLDLTKISQESHKLLTTVLTAMLLAGCWMIWSQTFSAFAVFDQVELWQYRETLDGKEAFKQVTLINLLLAVCYACICFILASNFPTLVDLLSAGKYELSPGSRYALIQLTRYSLVTIAFLAVANELGGSWEQVQWLVAALGVGMGFGLQEIFANMVSGIILLFERPIRVGDTVTVGDVTGRVVRIQMRATHIVDLDRKELVVPNKLFITDRLINWTLSDTVTRLVLQVGVDYGVDVREVEEALYQAIRNTHRVLSEPRPNVVFSGFGDSALMFDIHVFVHELLDRIEVRHELHTHIYQELGARGIGIPYPQRVVRIIRERS